MPRTRIVCTLGPSTDQPGVLDAMISAGMNVARLNFSHGSHDEHLLRIRQVRECADRSGATIAILADLQGPKFRIGDIASGSVRLREGDSILLTTRNVAGDAKTLGLPHPAFLDALRPGERLLLDDGSIALRVESVAPAEAHCRVVVGGDLSSRKGVSAPDSRLSVPSFTEKDREDTRFAVQHDVDMIALSFVRSAADLRTLRDHLDGLGARVMVVSKIEKREALDAFTEIRDASDAVMVARGDLGVETPAEEVPIHQKRIIQSCNHVAIPVITATQMLQSMVDSPTPTRAEASDVANAILDGTDAVMLSAETAAGRYPVEAVQVMARIAERAEAHLATRTPTARDTTIDPSDAIAQAAVEIAADLGAAAIISVTHTGYGPRRVSKYRPRTRVLAVTADPRVRRQLALVWGVQPLAIPPADTAEEVVRSALTAAREAGVAGPGDTIVLTGRLPVDARGHTNFLKLEVLE